MPIAYHVLAHRSPPQVAALVRALDLAPGDFCIVHYDARRPSTEHHTLRGLLDGIPSVVFQRPTRVRWGGWSLLRAQLEGLRLALASRSPWTHWVNLSGQCLPLQPRDVIEARLTPGRSRLDWFEPFQSRLWSERRISRVYPDSRLLDGLFRLPFLGRHLRSLSGSPHGLQRLPFLRRGPPPVPVFGHSNWVVLARDTARSLFQDAATARTLRWFRWSAAPEEMALATALLAGPLAPTLDQGNLRHIDFPAGAANPRTLGHSDLPALEDARSRGALWARKFDADRDIAFFDRVIEWSRPQAVASAHR